MLVRPIVIDLGWGKLKSELVNLTDSAFVASKNAAADRRLLLEQYTSAFRSVDAGASDKAKRTLKELFANISTRVVPDKHSALKGLVDGQLAKLG